MECWLTDSGSKMRLRRGGWIEHDYCEMRPLRETKAGQAIQAGRSSLPPVFPFCRSSSGGGCCMTSVAFKTAPCGNCKCPQGSHVRGRGGCFGVGPAGYHCRCNRFRKATSKPHGGAK